ncbi:Sodium/hydrogen exchanger family-domain-containing protein [Phyllosticta paracitricarpa]|uniref:Sodium/hydrogen exchanger family-domain-containing protein n=1 Tax=Phyllosticta paracitricarpa TaxID=2016321 RepID=A0ABR1MWZ8_9PEZI
MAASLPYHEPGIVTILIQSSFLLILNLINVIVDNTLYCGLLGQIFIGVAWGTPGAKWLDEKTEEVIVQLGYLGLILLVYEGGLSTSFASLKANLLLSIAVAITGIGLPIGLSFILQDLVGATPLQAFAAGAALCSTSLGTTFTVLSTSGLTKSRLGVVLTSAAMMDDVVGLVMVQVISNLGGSAVSFEATTVIRPVFVSLAFAVLTPLICYFIVKPCTLSLNKYREANPNGTLQKIFSQQHAPFAIHTLLLFALVAGGTYAGTSNLFTAYIAGACISWWDTELAHQPVENCIQNATKKRKEPSALADPRQIDSQSIAGAKSVHSATPSHIPGAAVYERLYQQAVERILKPLFFASIGFSIPISRMFSGRIVWRGIVYTLLMLLGKLACGLWLVRFSASTHILERLKRLGFRVPCVPHLVGKTAPAEDARGKGKGKAKKQKQKQKHTITDENVDAAQYGDNATQEAEAPAAAQPNAPSSSDPSASGPTASAPPSHITPSPTSPVSLYPGAIIGSAMVARGEIGFLISSVAQSRGVLSDEIYLVATWAIMLCTIIGPLAVGMLVRRVKGLQLGRDERLGGEGKRDVLGVWGVD